MKLVRSIRSTLIGYWQLILVALVLVIMVSTILQSWTRNYVIAEADKDVKNLLLQYKGLHHYVQLNAHPELYRLKEEGQISQPLYSPTLFSSSYIVRNIHKYYNKERKEAGLPEIYYKMAATNPRNPVNQASEREADLIKMFNENRDRTEFRDIVNIDGQEYLYVAKPFLANEERCLKCHGRREDSPPDLQAMYPGEGGFDEKIGEVRAIESIRAPLAGNMTIANVVLIATAVTGLGILGLMILNVHLREAVTARTQQIAEQTQQLRESEERLRSALSSAAMGTWRWIPAIDSDTRGAGLNRILGLEARETTQPINDFFSRIHTDDQQRVRAAFDRAIEEQGEYLDEFRIIQPDGTIRWIRDRGKPYYDDSGELIYVTGAAVDITELKLAEQELQQHREHLQELVGQRTGELIEKNQQLQKTLGDLESTQTQLIQAEKMAVLGRLASGIAHEINNPLAAIASTSSTMQQAIERFLADGPRFAALMQGATGDLICQAFEQALSISDIHLSSRRRRELRYQLTESLESHHIPDARTAADLMIDLGLQDHHKQFLPLLQDQEGIVLLRRVTDLAYIARSSRMIETATGRASKIVYTLYNYSRQIPSDEILKTDIRETIENVLLLYQNKIKNSVEIARQIDDDIPLIECHPDAIFQVWSNLIHNALQAMDFQGTLAIAIKKLGGEEIAVSITDTGCGITGEIKDRIFDPFFTTKVAGDGCGLGLDIVQGIIERHHGTIQLESTPEQGTTFTVTLPVHQTEMLDVYTETV